MEEERWEVGGCEKAGSCQPKTAVAGENDKVVAASWKSLFATSLSTSFILNLSLLYICYSVYRLWSAWSQKKDKPIFFADTRFLLSLSLSLPTPFPNLTGLPTSWR